MVDDAPSLHCLRFSGWHIRRSLFPPSFVPFVFPSGDYCSQDSIVDVSPTINLFDVTFRNLCCDRGPSTTDWVRLSVLPLRWRSYLRSTNNPWKNIYTTLHLYLHHNPRKCTSRIPTGPNTSVRFLTRRCCAYWSLVIDVIQVKNISVFFV